MASQPDQQEHDDFGKLAIFGAEMSGLAVRALAGANAFSPRALEYLAQIHDEMSEIFERAGNAQTSEGYKGFADDLRKQAADAEAAEASTGE